jgi:hypothetical protein
MASNLEQWCEWQCITEDFPNEFTCLAHMAEGRAFKCPYKDATDALKWKPGNCSDYEPKGENDGD